VEGSVLVGTEQPSCAFVTSQGDASQGVPPTVGVGLHARSQTEAEEDLFIPGCYMLGDPSGFQELHGAIAFAWQSRRQG